MDAGRKTKSVKLDKRTLVSIRRDQLDAVVDQVQAEAAEIQELVARYLLDQANAGKIKIEDWEVVCELEIKNNQVELTAYPALKI